jgi:hypothetical protein
MTMHACSGEIHAPFDFHTRRDGLQQHTTRRYPLRRFMSVCVSV